VTNIVTNIADRKKNTPKLTLENEVVQSKRRSLGWDGVGPIRPKSMLAVFDSASEYSETRHCQVNSDEKHLDES